MRTLTRDQLKEWLDRSEHFVLIDVLSPQSYERNHLPGAINIPLSLIGQAEHRFGKDQKIVVYCGSFECDMSPQAARELESLGFTNVWDFEGGLKDWLDAGFPAESGIQVGV